MLKTHNIYSNLNDQQLFRLNKINEIKYCFVAEIKERELKSKKLSKYVASFEYLDKSLIVLFTTTGSISIALFATVIGAPVGIGSARFIGEFSIFTGIVKQLLKTTRNNKKKHDKIIMLARSILNIIESKISEDFMIIDNEEKKNIDN